MADHWSTHLFSLEAGQKQQNASQNNIDENLMGSLLQFLVSEIG